MAAVPYIIGDPYIDANFASITLGGAGTVTSVASNFTGGLITVGGSPITASGTLALTVAGTSGGIPYFSSTSTWASSALLAANALMVGGGAGSSPATVTTGSGVLTALGIAVGSPGAFLTSATAGTGAVTILGQSGIPMIMAGSGSMGNNGALTFTTALVTTQYANAYVYLPAGAIASGSAAGWYYATFAGSTTAATVFNNTYTSGTPAIPGSPIPFVTTGPGSYTGASGVQTAYSLPIPGNTIGINGGIRVTLSGSYTSTADSKTIAAVYGATSLGSSGATTTTTMAAIWGFKNKGVTNAQIGLTVGNAQPFGTASNSLIYGTTDTTLSQNLDVRLTNSTPATNNVVLEQVTVELLPGVT